jgi:hypothetical protein
MGRRSGCRLVVLRATGDDGLSMHAQSGQTLRAVESESRERAHNA